MLLQDVEYSSLCYWIDWGFLVLFVFLINSLLFLAAHHLCCCAWLPPAAGTGGYSSLWCTGFSLQRLHLLQSTGSRCSGFSRCSLWAQYLWHRRHVRSSCTRDRNSVPCAGRQILHHCTTREALHRFVSEK